MDNRPDDPSDYARACRASKGWLGLIPSQGGALVVFGGDAGPIAWLSDVSVGEIGVFVHWLGYDSEDAVLRVLQDLTTVHAAARDPAEVLEFATGASGSIALFDATENGGVPEAGRLMLPLRPGRYRLNAYCVESTDCAVVLRELSTAPG